MERRYSRPSWSQSSVMKTLSFGWYVRTIRRSSLPSGWPPGPKRSSNVTFKLRLRERYAQIMTNLQWTVEKVGNTYHWYFLSIYWLTLCFLCFQINIDHKTRDLIRRNIKAPSTVCFDDAQRIVYGLMERDSYPRFLRSDIYRTLMDSISESVKM